MPGRNTGHLIMTAPLPSPLPRSPPLPHSAESPTRQRPLADQTAEKRRCLLYAFLRWTFSPRSVPPLSRRDLKRKTAKASPARYNPVLPRFCPPLGYRYPPHCELRFAVQIQSPRRPVPRSLRIPSSPTSTARTNTSARIGIRLRQGRLAIRESHRKARRSALRIPSSPSTPRTRRVGTRHWS